MSVHRVCIYAVFCRYRGVVEGVPSRTEIQVFYSDFGNVSIVTCLLQPLLEDSY